MDTTQSQRIQASCEIIWGKCDYEIGVDTDDYENYMGCVRKDFGSEFGPPLAMTALYSSSEGCWAELDRMLGTWAEVAQGGKPMTHGQRLDIFGGPGGKNKQILEVFAGEAEKRKAAEVERRKGGTSS